VAPVGGADITHAEKDDEEHDRDFDDDDGGVEGGALLDADYQDGGDDQRDQKRRKIETDFDAEQDGGGDQIVSALEKFRR
jgi:hypothetical protein